MIAVEKSAEGILGGAIAEGPNGWKWGVETRISTTPCGRTPVVPGLLAKTEG